MGAAGPLRRHWAVACGRDGRCSCRAMATPCGRLGAGRGQRGPAPLFPSRPRLSAARPHYGMCECVCVCLCGIEAVRSNGHYADQLDEPSLKRDVSLLLESTTIMMTDYKHGKQSSCCVCARERSEGGLGAEGVPS